MYTDEVHLTAGNVMSVLYASQKYIITNLTKECLRFLEANLSTEIALQLVGQTMLFDDTDFKQKVLAKIEVDAPVILTSSDFCKLSEPTLHEVLQLQLHINKEIDLFEACLRWAQTKLKEVEKSIEGTNLREVLGKNLFLIRFPTMTVEDIINVVVPSDVLTSSEVFQVTQYITAKAEKPENLPFPTKPRTRSLLISPPYKIYTGRVLCHQKTIFSTKLTCNVSKPVNLKQIYVHAGDLRDVSHSLFVMLEQEGQTILHRNRGNVNTDSSELMPAYFAVDASNLKVKCGVMKLTIQISLLQPGSSSFTGNYTIGLSAPASSKLSDDYVSIDFAPVSENLLLGIQYSQIE